MHHNNIIRWNGQQGTDHIERKRTGEGEAGAGGVCQIRRQLLDDGAARQDGACVHDESGPLSGTDRKAAWQGG